jgi:hypothetical protein
MQIVPPFGYREITPLMQDHRVRQVLPKSVPDFARTSNSLPVTFSEIVHACHDYPLMFVSHDADKHFALVAVLGVGAGENLFATATGWKQDAYVPAYVRRYPFCMTRVTLEGVQQSQRLICIEKDWISAEGESFFDEQRKPTQRWTEIQNILHQYEAELDLTLSLCAMLRDFKLLEPMSMQATINGVPTTLGGMHCVSSERMKSLNSSEIKTLYKSGALSVAYHHLGSVNRFEKLVAMKAALAQDPGTAEQVLAGDIAASV